MVLQGNCDSFLDGLGSGRTNLLGELCDGLFDCCLGTEDLDDVGRVGILEFISVLGFTNLVVGA